MEGLVIEGGSQRMKILITGNLGYVGPWVTRALRARVSDGDRLSASTQAISHIA